MKAKRLILFLIWLMMVVAYFDRVNISLAGPTIMASLHLTKGQFGGVLSAFQTGYALMQIPGGLLADRLGSRPLLIAAILIWSAFTALTGTARSLGPMVAIRVLFGMGEGLENGAQFKLIGDNFDSRERSRASGLFLSALAVGPAIASPVVTWLIGIVGWRGLFFWSAGLGLIVAAILHALLPRPAPTDAPVVRTDVTDASGHVLNWKSALVRPTSWLSFAAYLLFNIGFWGFVYWMPTYLSATRHIDLKHLGPLSAIPFVGGFFGLLTLGALGTTPALAHRRPLLVGAGYVLAAAFLYVTFSATTLAGCLAGLTLAAFFLYGGFGPFWAVAIDLVPAGMRGGFTGFVNVGGQIGGIIAPLVVGRIVDATGSFTNGFLFMMAALALAAGVLVVLYTFDVHRNQSDEPVFNRL